MSKSHERGLSRDPSRPSAPNINHQPTVCVVCGGPVVHRSTVTEDDRSVENYRCRGQCRSGGHRVHRDGQILSSNGPVFTGDANRVLTYPSELTSRIVGVEEA
jgi:hypothetical protein